VDGWHWTTGLINARNENARLHRYQDEYTVLAARYQTLAQEAQKLQQLLNFKGSPIGKTYGSVAASVTVQSTDAYDGSVVIDAGTGDGLAPGDPVVAPYGGGGGLIGVTTSCVSSSCAVRLITDQQVGDSVTAKVLGSEAHGPLTPSSGDPGLLDLEMVSIATPVQTGATVVSWHLVGNRLQALLPAGIPIGRVSSVSQSDTSGGFKNIQVTPFVDFQNLSSVLVLRVAHAH
jgi:rod shape-determining protein MreC